MPGVDDASGAAAADGAPQLGADGEIVARLTDIGHSFGSLTVLEQCSLDVSANAMTAIVGPNGSGKTTLLRIAAGLLAPDSGTRSLDINADRSIGYLPQDSEFRASLTVEETLQFYADLLMPDVAIDEAMAQVGLTAVSDRQIGALSGGMRRLLGLAVSLLGDPPLIVLDEPTSGLDPRMQQHVRETVDEITASGTAILMTTHDLLWAAQADRLVLLNEGRLIVEGTPEEIMGNAQSDSLADAFLDILGEDPTVQAGRGKS